MRCAEAERDPRGEPERRSYRDAARRFAPLDHDLRVRDRGARVVRGHAVGPGRERCEQCLVREDVDAPREALGGFGDDRERLLAEEVGAVVARRAQPEIHVLADVAARERREREAMGDALLQLAHVGQAQVAVELGLPEEDDLQQLVGAGLEVREKAHFLERAERHRVRLVDEGNHLLAFRMHRDELLLQRAQHLRRVRPGHVDAEVGRDRAQHLVAREARHREVDHLDRGREPLHQHAAEHRLAAADLAGDLDQALARRDRVEKRFERGAAVGARVEELRVGRDAEGRFPQSEMLEVHRHGRLGASPGSGRPSLAPARPAASSLP